MKTTIFINRMALLGAILFFAAGSLQATIRTVTTATLDANLPGSLLYEIKSGWLNTGDTLTFDSSVNTINLLNGENIIGPKVSNVTVLGNGVTFTCIPANEDLKNAYIEFDIISIVYFTSCRVENIHFELPVNITKNSRIINCTFKPDTYLADNCSLNCLDNSGNDSFIEGCAFLSEASKMAWVQMGTGSTIHFISCTVINNTADHKTFVRQRTTTSASGKYVIFTNCVLLDKGATNTSPSVSLYNIQTKGYNVFQGFMKPYTGGPAWTVQSSDIELEPDATDDPLTFDGGIYKVTSGGAAHRNLPANPNGTIGALADVTFPKKDLSGNDINYMSATHSGAWQDVYGDEGGENDEIVVTDVTVNILGNGLLFTDTTYQFTAAVFSQGGNATQEVTWECDDTHVEITPSETDKLSASFYAEGITEDTDITVKVKAKENGANGELFVKEYTVTLKPYVHVSTIQLTNLSTVTFGYERGMRATVLPANANWKDLEWTVDDPAVASITVQGDSITIKGLTEGTTTVMVQAKDNKLDANNSATVTVSRPDYSDGVFIVNEDWWGHRTGSVNFLYYSDGHIDYNTFWHANNRSLGSPAQFGAIYGGRFYIISKDGLRLAVTDARTLELQKGFLAPGGEGRFFFGVDEHTGYVGTSGGIRVVNLNNLPGVPGDYVPNGQSSPDPLIVKVLPGTDIAAAQSSSGAFKEQVTTMKRVGNRIFALQQGILRIINATSHQVETTLNDYNYIAMTQSKDGYIWLGTSGTVPTGEAWNPTEEADEDVMTDGELTNYFVRLDPWTLEQEVVPLPGGVTGPGSVYGAWQADAFQGSERENVIYWKSGGQSISRYNITTNQVDTVLDLSDMPHPGIGAPWTLYGTSFAVDHRTGELAVVTGTFLITCCIHDRDNWKILRVNPNGGLPRADGQGVIGNIISEHPLETNYWFPAMPVFPDTHQPEFTNVSFPSAITLGATHPVDSLDLLYKVADADNMRAAMVTTVESGYNTQLINAFIWRDTLVVAACKNIPAGHPAEQTQLKLKFNSNGHVIYKELTVTVSSGTIAYPVTGVTLNRTTADLAVGQSLQLTATVQPGDADNKAVTWTSLTPTVATVANGYVTAHTAGTAFITVTTVDGSYSATCTVTVKAAAPSYPFELNRHYLTLPIAQTAQLDLLYPLEYTVAWRSEDESIAMVSSTGKVMGVAEGTTRIIAEDKAKNKSDFCVVTVPPAVILNPFELNTHSLTLDVSETAQLSLTAPEQYTVAWRSQDESIAIVSSTGKVVAMSAGATQIIAEDKAMNKSDACAVTVRPKQTGTATIRLNHTVLVMNEGDMMTVQAIVSSSGQTVTWSTSNPRVADVTSGGMIIAVGGGNALITASLPDGTSAQCSITVRDVSVSAEVSDAGEDKATIIYPKISGTLYYMVHLYEVSGSGQTPVVALKVNSDGTIANIVSLRSSSNKIRLTLSGLRPSTPHQVCIDVVRDINGVEEAVSVLQVSFTTSSATGTETLISAGASDVWYAGGVLRLTNLEGHVCRVISVTGQVQEIFKTVSGDEIRSVSLPPGIYILTAQKEGEVKTFRFVTFR